MSALDSAAIAVLLTVLILAIVFGEFWLSSRVSKRTMVAIAIVAVLILGGSVYIATLPAPPTEAQKMVLTAGDLGPKWKAHDNLWTGYPYPGKSSGWSGGYWIENETGAFVVASELIVFNTTAACRAAYENENSTFFDNRSVNNYTVVQIGDRAVYMNYFGCPEVMFIRGTVLCTMYMIKDIHGPYDWSTSAIIKVVNLQLDKINRHLGL